MYYYMPQTSPMSWMLLSVSPIFMLNFLTTMKMNIWTKKTIIKNSSMNLYMKWKW